MSQSKNQMDILVFATAATKWIESNFKIILGLCAVALIGGSVFAFTNAQARKAEKKAFDDLYAITKIYDKKKAGFDEAVEKEKAPKDKKKDEKEVADQMKDLKKATGQLEVDYPEVVPKLEKYLQSHKGMNAAGEAALVLSEIYDTYKMPDKGAEALSSVLKTWSTKNVLYFVMQMRVGDLYASSSDCENAVSYWQVVADSKSFFARQAQLKLGVCLQQIGRVEEAKQWFTRVQEKEPNSSEGFSAKRYLRFLEFKTKTGEGESEDKAQTKDQNKDQPS